MNSFGRIFRLSILGESHGSCVGVVLDGIPSGIALSPEDFEADLARRRPGATGTTPRKESDIPNLKSGVFNGHTTGAPLLILFENSDIESKSYESLKNTPRPGHADYVANKKFHGFNDYRGGGHFSGRLTTCLVAAGVVAKKILPGLQFEARLIEAGGSSDIETAVQQALKEGDSIGGIVECTVKNIPVGLGEPFFDSVESVLSHALFAIPAIKAIEFGAGFAAARMKGSMHNDSISSPSGLTETNNAGGINGGITNGNPIIFRVAVKPTSSIVKEKSTIDLETGSQKSISVTGRHDACIALRVPPVIESVTAIVLTDLFMCNRAICHGR